MKDEEWSMKDEMSLFFTYLVSSSFEIHRNRWQEVDMIQARNWGVVVASSIRLGLEPFACKISWMNMNEHEWTWMSMNEHEWTWINMNEHEWVWMSMNEHEWVKLPLFFCRIVRLSNPFLMTILRFLTSCIGRFSRLKTKLKC